MKIIIKPIYLILPLALLAMVIVTACDLSTFSTASKSTSQFDIKLTDIGFKQNMALFSSDILLIPSDNLLFKVDVTPKDTFKGEPFRTVQLSSKYTGDKTLVQSTPAIWIALLSKDGYFFSSHGPLTWTPEELQLPDSKERDYYKIQSIKELRVKHVTIYVPSSDKATVALLQDSNKLMLELQQKQWKWIIKGDWLLGGDLPKEADEEYIRRRFEELFSRYFKLMIVDSDGLQKLTNPDGQTKLIKTWSGKGKFTTPTFFVTYDRIITSWVGNPLGQFEYNLYSVDGKNMGGARMSAEPDVKHRSGNSVYPGKSYYIDIIAPQEKRWTFWLEETNLP